jgi:DNA-binding CsgD family transcriptional regulator
MDEGGFRGGQQVAHDALIDLASLLSEAPDPFVPFEAFVRKFDVQGYFYGYTALRNDIPVVGYTRSIHYRHTYSNAWEKAVGAASLVDHDPSLPSIEGGEACVIWQPENSSDLIHGLTPEQRFQFEVECDLGMVSGASLALQNAGATFSGIGIWCETKARHEGFTRLWTDIAPTIFQASRLLDLAVREGKPNLLVQLTPREIDCLSWLARGLRPSEICWRIGISEKTFEKHISSAKTKLKSRTRDQALAKALLMRLLPL